MARTNNGARAGVRRARAAIAIAGMIAALGVNPAVARSTAATCGDSPAGNGTGYRPPSNPSSLPTGDPAPGPAILHAPLISTPQLDNADPWTAPPTMVSGTQVYADGEYVNQDFLYDDLALTYPDEPERYAGNAADIVEVRLRPLDDATAIRITFNTMLDVDAVGITIALGGTDTTYSMPHNAGVDSPGEVFVTVHGCDGDIVDAASGTPSTITPTVATDLVRRQVDVRVPYTAFDPRGRTDVRVAAGAGLWSAGDGEYLRPDPALPAFFNVAFRGPDEWTQNTLHEDGQAAALAAGDLSAYVATVDFTKLAAAVDDPRTGEPGGLPVVGPMNRIMVSNHEPAQGRGGIGGGAGGCVPPECIPEYAGRLQPYSVYVPDRPAAPDGYAFVLNLHGANSNHNHFEGGSSPAPKLEMWRILAEEGSRRAIHAMPNARGTGYYYQGLAAVDVFEMWAHVAANFDLDPDRVIQSGSSMGGFGGYKLASQFPDLYTAAFINVGLSGAPLNAPPAPAPAGEGRDVWRMYDSLRNVPVLASSGINDAIVNYQNTKFSQTTLAMLGYRHDYSWFTGTSGTGHEEYRHYVTERYAELLDDHGPTDRDPRRVTYVLNADMHDPDLGVDADHAYWLSAMDLADETAIFGTIDVVSHGFGSGDPVFTQALPEGGLGPNGLPMERQHATWGDAPAAPVADELTITADNVAAVTIDVDRARVSCAAALNIDSTNPIEVTLVGDGCATTSEPSAATTSTSTPTASTARLAATGGTSTGHDLVIPLLGLAIATSVLARGKVAQRHA